MDYPAAVERLYTLGAELYTAPGRPRRKFELGQMHTLLRALGDPQKSFRSVLIAGTNGKGSTAATLASILAAAGYRAGLYTSPHLILVNERIQILGAKRETIGDTEFAALFAEVDQVAGRLVSSGDLPGFPSFFECITAMAFLHFARRGVDLAVLEVGMGGRLDATNVVEPLLSIITDISLDHTEWLGSTLTEIAREKAGILRRDGVMVTLPQHPEVNQALGEVAVDLGVRGVSAAEFLPGRAVEQPGGANRYTVQTGGCDLAMDSPLRGQHQQRNTALAIAAAAELSNSYGYSIVPAAVAEGIRGVQWPGRLERLRLEGFPEIVLDVGHNPAGAWALRAALMREDKPERTLIFGCLQDKPVREMAQILFPISDRVILVQVASPRASTLEQMRVAAVEVGAAAETATSFEAALDRARAATGAEGQIVVTGSVVLVGMAEQVLYRMREQVSA